ncbi:hypothetical protein QMO56_06200 [Roseomonas sp. E05]|uniref:hypothetical protein n=1 Tax=Roseomonas sp. E05 TaxID=3046310 RepID=UPI0024BA30D5|nr:hypothetical protein [Roseomonas sp. E05]MDJ0387698.1 hypothetical protein [Roseomonas sp. E05]
MEAALRAVLRRQEAVLGHPPRLTSELGEQGLQTAALSLASAPLAVRTNEVTICSPFWPRQPELGSHGAHFVGLNARHIARDYYDRPADDWMRAHWARHRAALYRRTVHRGSKPGGMNSPRPPSSFFRFPARAEGAAPNRRKEDGSNR